MPASQTENTSEVPAGRTAHFPRAAHLPVNDGLVLGEAEDSGPGVSFLRFGGNTAYLNKTKAHLVQSVHSLPVLVKSRRNSYRVSELTAQDSHFLGRGRQSQRHTGQTRVSQAVSCHVCIRLPGELGRQHSFRLSLRLQGVRILGGRWGGKEL